MSRTNVFAPIRQSTLADSIAGQIIAAIARGRLRVGDQLPAERDLAQAMEVSRPSVRTALNDLAKLGVVETRRSAGTFVKSDAVPLALWHDRWDTRIDQSRDQLEVRRLIEPRVAQIAAIYGTQDDFEAVEQVLALQREALDDRDRFLNLEMRFHVVLARATKNAATAKIIEVVLRQLAILQDYALRDRAALEHELALHAETLAAVVSREPAQIEIAMDRHLSFLEGYFSATAGCELLREMPEFLLPEETAQQPGLVRSHLASPTDFPA